MKKDRNCMNPYPVYPTYQGMPMMGNFPMMGMPIPYSEQSYITNQPNNYENQIKELNTRINSLEKRISNIEEMINQNNSVNYSNTQYSSSNYPMM